MFPPVVVTTGGPPGHFHWLFTGAPDRVEGNATALSQSENPVQAAVTVPPLVGVMVQTVLPAVPRTVPVTAALSPTSQFTPFPSKAW